MSYGFSIMNAQNVPVIEYDNCLYIKQDSATIRYVNPFSSMREDFHSMVFDTILTNAQRQNYWVVSDSPSIPISAYGVGLGGRYYFPATLNFYVLPNDPALGQAAGRNMSCPITDQMSENDTVFYQVGTIGLRKNFEIAVRDVPGLPDGLFTSFMPGVKGALPVRVCSPELPDNLTGQFGMQIFDENVNCTFDSRAPFMSIAAAYLIRKESLLSVLDTGAAEDITLPESMPNCWVSVPFFCPYKMVFSEDIGFGTLVFNYYFVNITQVNATTLRLSRNGPVRVQTGSPNSSRTFTHDAIMYVARST